MGYLEKSIGKANAVYRLYHAESEMPKNDRLLGAEQVMSKMKYR